ncbi:redoxin domain-containing protein [Polaribacter dokdonensis]|jgi:peroxiredoxin|uniref:AhpC/TSA family protein n=1 Tax=Polaribacter dokdonensis DSW-5 TaxID=1300348 RepID=A0A0M9CHB8_9FLAO|nr:redoxin domain-containing protein [Polaribacter dokdonensis]KOY52641.1 AhpC/TSA family protein [Polaribacter dokdonensis DSW-5]SEE49528.1 Peroxiredoxin [Polaribacter dokdonensis DSW-5]
MIKPREKTPDLKINLVNDTKWSLHEQSPENFTLIIFYRGIHCPVCKKQLEQLKKKMDDFTERGVNLIAISADTEEKAKKAYKDWDIESLPVGYDLPIEEGRKWGLFVSKGISDKEPDTFLEPGLFLIDKEQKVYWQSIQSMPFGRPEFRDVLNGIDYILKEGYPARGEA